MKIMRRDFLIQALALPAVAVLMARFFSACAKDNSSAGVTCSQGFTATSSTDSGHTHTITVALADITAAADKTYTTSTDASHSHSVTLTAADFAKLAANQGTAETTASDSSGHTHTFTITCA